eukprot:TRINITY_DN15302_c0_g1_i2.p1 TRINITY_DN15302_c0_g1~~TRINITY_DN15302_c0_g1_i2.p1  ORF type:complete len:103 (-),score=3.76 TRINITY_DN15302_c0_g1_i2:247-555(-)
MQCFQAGGHLDEDGPKLALRERCVFVDVLRYPIHEIPSIRKFHHYAQRTRCIFEESFLVCDYVWMASVELKQKNLMEASIRTSFTAFSRSLVDKWPIFTYSR